FLNRDTKTLLPTEFILALVKREIENAGRVSLFIDGFPRNMNQITYSLYFRELINYRNDPDMFVLIDVPEKVIDERIKYRRICPKCFTSRNLSLNPSSIVKYDYGLKEFYLMCDNPECTPTRMVGKEGDELGIESIRNRIEMDDKLIRRAFELHGVPKIMLRNSIPTEIADEITDPYEVTEDLEHSIDENGRISTRSKSWEIIDDNGIPSVSLMPPPVVISCIHQLHEILIT
ncbi:nucleoside monophosphate kinase, partial [Candidatus Dojkabacteria bacterium]|nr:nucleoside monophosphate kinase [Candidatus Dojkabacteria bacterium]